MTGDRPQPGPGPVLVDADPLSEFLKLARQEGALEGENLEAFALGLRERADRVIAERLGRVEAKLRALETENLWQRDAIATLTASVNSLDGEKAWLRETVGGLEGERAWLREAVGSLEGEKARLREAVGSLEGEKVWLRETLGNLEGEKAWLRETLGNLEGEKAWLRETLGSLEGEKTHLRETIGALEAEAMARTRAIEDAWEERRKASVAHESLLAHHRELMARLAGQLGEIASLSPLRANEVRRRLRALADVLRADSP